MASNPLKSEAEYEDALKEIQRLWNSAPGTPAGIKLDELINRIEAYEAKYHPIAQPTGTFRPSRHRLHKIAERGADLLISASDDDLGTFTE